MLKKIVSLLMVFIILFSSISVKSDNLKISPHSAILMDYSTGNVLYAVNENEKLPPASITKVMTLILTMEALDTNKIKLEDEVVISEQASKATGTTVYLDAGEIQTVDNLIKAVTIRSANDAAIALAEHISGSEESFVELMNNKAKVLAMESSKFSNCTGLPSSDHYSTAHDIALMSKELLNWDKIHNYLTRYMDDIEVGKSKKSIQTMVNTNRLVKEFKGTTGIKTGFTNDAKHCISASAKRENLHLIAVILRANSSKERFDQAKNLLEYGFSNYETKTLGNKGDIISNILVEKGRGSTVEAILENDAYVLLDKNNKSQIETTINCPESIKAPIKEGEILGNLIIKIKDKEVYRVNILAKNTIKRSNILDSLKKVWSGYIFN